MAENPDIVPAIEGIDGAIDSVIKEYPIKKMSLFGSYAKGDYTADSDVDILVEFKSPSVSLLTLSSLKFRLEELLDKPVDVVHAPLPEHSLIAIDHEVLLYES